MKGDVTTFDALYFGLKTSTEPEIALQQTPSKIRGCSTALFPYNPTSLQYLKRVFGMTNDQCSKIFILPFNVTLDTKLRWFQYRVIHNTQKRKSRTRCSNSYPGRFLLQLCSKKDKTLARLNPCITTKTTKTVAQKWYITSQNQWDHAAVNHATIDKVKYRME